MNEKRVAVFLNERIKDEIKSRVFGDDFIAVLGAMIEELTGEEVKFFIDHFDLKDKKRVVCFRIKKINFCIEYEAVVLSEP